MDQARSIWDSARGPFYVLVIPRFRVPPSVLSKTTARSCQISVVKCQQLQQHSTPYNASTRTSLNSTSYIFLTQARPASALSFATSTERDNDDRMCLSDNDLRAWDSCRSFSMQRTSSGKPARFIGWKPKEADANKHMWASWCVDTFVLFVLGLYLTFRALVSFFEFLFHSFGFSFYCM